MVFKEIGMVFLYLFICTLFTGILGCYLYKIIFLKKLSLKDKLFQHDSMAVWLEIIGGFLAPVFFLISIVIAPNGKFVYQGTTFDLLVAITYIFLYILTFCIVRYITEIIYKFITKIKFGESYSLSKEIFIENNPAASFFSISTSVIVVGIMLQENIIFENITSNIIRMLLVIILNIGLASLYTTFVFPKNRTILNDIFIENNISSGMLLLGNLIAINIIITSSIELFKHLGLNWLSIQNIIDVILFICLIYLFMMVFVTITKKILAWFLKVDIENEIFNQKNIGYVIFEAAFYILLSFMAINLLIIH